MYVPTSRELKKRKHIAMLAAPGVGIIPNSECSDRHGAALLLSDRVANSEAFRGEFVVRVPANLLMARIRRSYSC